MASQFGIVRAEPLPVLLAEALPRHALAMRRLADREPAGGARPTDENLNNDQLCWRCGLAFGLDRSELAGYIGWRATRRAVLVQALVVDPATRGRGVGHQLVELAMGELKLPEPRLAITNVPEAVLESAGPFFASLGFRASGRQHAKAPGTWEMVFELDQFGGRPRFTRWTSSDQRPAA